MHHLIYPFPGFLVAQTRQGGVQTQHSQLLGSDQRQPDTEHDHVQTRQEKEGCLRTTAGEESCKLHDQSHGNDSNVKIIG